MGCVSMLKQVLMCRFRVDYALSREQKNKKGGKMYIQDKVEEYADEVFDLLDNGAHIYFCGLKGMMPGTAAGSVNAGPVLCLLCICFWVFVIGVVVVCCRSASICLSCNSERIMLSHGCPG